MFFVIIYTVERLIHLFLYILLADLVGKARKKNELDGWR